MNLGRISPIAGFRPTQRPDYSNPWQMESFALNGIRNIEERLTGGVLGTNHEDPNILRDFLSRFMALLGLQYGFEDERYQITEENKKALAKSQNLALAA